MEIFRLILENKLYIFCERRFLKVIIKNIKGTISSEDKILEILKYSHWNPTRERLLKLLKAYNQNDNIYMFGSFIENNVVAIIVIQKVCDNTFEIIDISVDAKNRNKRIASKLIDFVVKKFNVKTLFAETDDDAVGFYKKYGFRIKSTKRKGYLRYKCCLSKSNFDIQKL